MGTVRLLADLTGSVSILCLEQPFTIGSVAEHVLVIVLVDEVVDRHLSQLGPSFGVQNRVEVPDGHQA